jgi:hypothetical protein
MRHFAANISERHKTKEVIKRLKLLCASKAERTIKRSLVSLEKVMNNEVKAWIQNEMGNKEKWVAAFDDGAWRYSVHNTNISEVLNKVFKGRRAMPVLAIVEYSFYKLNLYFVHRWQKAGIHLENNDMWRKMGGQSHGRRRRSGHSQIHGKDENIRPEVVMGIFLLAPKLLLSQSQ